MRKRDNIVSSLSQITWVEQENEKGTFILYMCLVQHRCKKAELFKIYLGLLNVLGPTCISQENQNIFVSCKCIWPNLDILAGPGQPESR